MSQSVFSTYQHSQSTLQRDSLALSAAELHGLLTGLLTAGMPTSSPWLGILYDYTNQGDIWPDTSIELAKTLFNETHAALHAELMDFVLFLPEENTSLSTQAEALSDWVNGFLAGFGLAGVSPTLSDESKEALADLAQIAQLGIDEDGEEQEQLTLLMDVSEHARICVLTLQADNLLNEEAKKPFDKKGSDTAQRAAKK